MVWEGGGGKWLASPPAERLLPGGSSPKAKTRRNIRSAEKGQVVVRGPIQSVYPSIIEMNGTQYSDERAGNLLYTDTDGRALNLTALFL